MVLVPSLSLSDGSSLSLPVDAHRVGSGHAVAGGSTHSLTKKGAARGRGSHLSAEGVALARLVGESLGPFAAVVTSASPRAIETALAIGFAVDDAVELPSGYVPGEVDHHDQWG
jgi:Histidine phosphatase superfamily (branch 1)